MLGAVAWGFIKQSWDNTLRLRQITRKEVLINGGPIKLSSMFMMLQGYKKPRHASWRTGRHSAALPER